MTVDVELTLNRFAFRRVALNKIQLGCLRIAWWPADEALGWDRGQLAENRAVGMKKIVASILTSLTPPKTCTCGAPHRNWFLPLGCASGAFWFVGTTTGSIVLGCAAGVGGWVVGVRGASIEESP